MKVQIYTINTTDGKRYGLRNATTGDVLYTATSRWKTANGAKRYALKRGYDLIEERE